MVVRGPQSQIDISNRVVVGAKRRCSDEPELCTRIGQPRCVKVKH